MKKSLTRKRIEAVAISLCADYMRRKAFVENRLGERRVRMEYAYINAKLFDAASEIAGPNQAEIYISEIGQMIGYANSKIRNISECTYKINKERIKENVLRKIYYINSFDGLKDVDGEY